MSEQDLPRIRWPGNFYPGDKVNHKGKKAKVIDVPLRYVPSGEVPIIYEGKKAFVTVPADDINFGDSQ